MENNYVSSLRWLEEINRFIDKNILVGMKIRFHALSIGTEALYG
jgi:hypothetical protein